MLKKIKQLKCKLFGCDYPYLLFHENGVDHFVFGYHATHMMIPTVVDVVYSVDELIKYKPTCLNCGKKKT